MWLIAFFEDQLQNSAENESAILEMLQAILNYTRYTKVCPNPVLKFDWKGLNI